MKSRIEKLSETPAEWIERYFWIPDPRDPVTGEFFEPGPIRLADFQKRLINEALFRKPDGKFKYSTVVYSAVKKSGKSALASAVTLYMAYSRPDSYVYCLANDKTQSTDRIYVPIYKNFRIHRNKNGPLKHENPNLTEVMLSNNTLIRAIPCDAAGEAGSQPLFSCFSELWGFDTENKKRLWSEMTIPPTLYGYAMQWVESYAGFTGKSELLEQLYDLGVTRGTPHPDFKDLKNNDGTPTVFVNEAAGLFCYWDHTPRMVWQTPEYYAQEAMRHPPDEFARIHRNEWVSPIDSFITPSLWEPLKKKAKPLAGNVPVVLGIDAAISNDFAAIVGVTRDPDNGEHVLIRFCYIFTPQKSGGNIKISKDVEPKLRELCSLYNVVCVAYDKYQLEDLAQRLRNENFVWMYNFSQQNERAIADKSFYDRILNQTVWWDEKGDNLDKNGDVPSLYQHIIQAGAKKEGGKMRLEKLSERAKIDAAVAASMAIERCLQLMITNEENDLDRLIEQHNLGQISDYDFLRQVKNGRNTDEAV